MKKKFKTYTHPRKNLRNLKENGKRQCKLTDKIVKMNKE